MTVKMNHKPDQSKGSVCGENNEGGTINVIANSALLQTTVTAA